jgi:hypothetical protein
LRGASRLGGSYGGFNAKQRVALAIAALARDDDLERTRLWETAPKQTHVTHEAAYVRMWQLASEFTTFFAAVHLGPPLAATAVMDRTQDLINELSRVEEVFPADADPRTPISDQPIDVLYALLAQMAERTTVLAAEQAHAFSAFSEQELGVSGSVMIDAFARLWAPIYKALETVEAAPEVVAAIADAYRETWRLRMERQPIL